MLTFLLHFVHQHPSFRLAEFRALVDLFQGHVVIDEEEARAFEEDEESGPFLTVKMESEELARNICSRSITLLAVYDLWATGTSYEELQRNIMESRMEEMMTCLVGKRWRMMMDSFGRRYSREEQYEIMGRLKELPLWEQGTISMKEFDMIFTILENFGVGRSHSEPLKRVYFGRKLMVESGREGVHRYNLRQRDFLGTTSMDPELSMISANMAHARQGSIVFDPFVGTGSFLVSCSHFGSMTMGADLDIRTTQALEGPSVYGNMTQYSFMDRFIGIVLADASRPPWRSKRPLFDSIICDPPYGIRAGARKIGKKKKNKFKSIPEGYHESHFPQCINYEVPDVMRDLLAFAAKSLVMNGRLVYWLPTTPDYLPTDLPLHPCLKLVGNSLQTLTSRWGRRLITMVKITEYNPDIHDQLPAEQLGQTTAAHGVLRKKIFEPSK